MSEENHMVTISYLFYWFIGSFFTLLPYRDTKVTLGFSIEIYNQSVQSQMLHIPLKNSGWPSWLDKASILSPPWYYIFLPIFLLHVYTKKGMVLYEGIDITSKTPLPLHLQKELSIPCSNLSRNICKNIFSITSNPR